MKLVIQRVLSADVKIDNKIYNKIGNGYLIYVCFLKGDDETILDKIVDKVVKLRIFEDINNKMNEDISSLKNPEILLISQFTLAANAMDGNRPSFSLSLEKEKAKYLYDKFLEKLNKYIKTKPGIFGADMKVSSVNDGPVTILIDWSSK